MNPTITSSLRLPNAIPETINSIFEFPAFVDCTILLLGTGKAVCTTGSTSLPPTCNITCEHFEDQPAIFGSIFKCQLSGKWEPELPRCAAPTNRKYKAV